MVSASSLSASQAYSSTTVSPWKVRGLGIFLASGGSIVMRAQSNDEPPIGFGTIGAVRAHLLLTNCLEDELTRPNIELAPEPPARRRLREGARLTFPLGSLVSPGKGRFVTEWSQVPAVARPLPEPEPQPVLAPLTAAAIFMVLIIEPGGEDAVRDLLADWAGLQRSVGFRVPEAPLACVAGIGSDAWDRLFSGPRPAELHPFRELAGTAHRAPSTQGDLLFHLRHERMDVCFEFASQVMTRLARAATVVDEVHGFRYFDERDLLGFVDGTENPVGQANRSIDSRCPCAWSGHTPRAIGPRFYIGARGSAPARGGFKMKTQRALLWITAALVAAT